MLKYCDCGRPVDVRVDLTNGQTVTLFDGNVGSVTAPQVCPTCKMKWYSVDCLEFSQPSGITFHESMIRGG